MCVLAAWLTTLGSVDAPSHPVLVPSESTSMGCNSSTVWAEKAEASGREPFFPCIETFVTVSYVADCLPS